VARPRWHALTTFPLAVALARRAGPGAALGAVAGGVLIDGDHLVDYAWTRLRGEKSHYFAPLHGWEVVLALAASALVPGRWQAPLGGVVVGMTLHLVQDVVVNQPAHPGVYSLLYRLLHGFSRECTGWKVEHGFHNWSELPWYRWWQAM